MTSALNPAQTDVLTALRGTRDDRPTIRPQLRKELQDEIEAALSSVRGRLTIEKHALSKVHQCEGRYLALEMFEWNPANARGTIAHKAIELSVGGTRDVTPERLVEAAIRRICESPDSQSLAEYLRSIDDAERAELRVGVTDLVIKFAEMFPPLQEHWWPNAEATTACYIGDRKIVFRGKIDLKLGQLDAHQTSTLIIDIKTGNPSFSDMEDLRFYALLETLRTGVPPFRWANAYISAGRVEVEDVREEVLWSAAKRLVDGTRKIARLLDKVDDADHGTQPRLSPGIGCRFCPANLDCEALRSAPADHLTHENANHFAM